MELNGKQQKFIEDKLKKLKTSKFRANFHLKDKDISYVNEKSLAVIEKHAFDFIIKRLSDNNLLKDGKQTPMRGHPVFIAQHATATCCRGCLYKWHHIEKNKKLSEREINFIVALIIEWIKNEMRGKDLYG